MHNLRLRQTSNHQLKLPKKVFSKRTLYLKKPNAIADVARHLKALTPSSIDLTAFPRRFTFSSQGLKENDRKALKYFKNVKNHQDLSYPILGSSAVF